MIMWPLATAAVLLAFVTQPLEAKEKAKLKWLDAVRHTYNSHNEDVYVTNVPTLATREGSSAVIYETLIMTNQLPRLSHHSSSVVELSNGDLLATWFGGTFEGEPDVGIWTSRFPRATHQWSSPEEVVRPHAEPCWNPVLFRRREADELLLFYKVGLSPMEWNGFLIRSSNDGRSWSPPTALPEGIVGPSKNKPTELTDGTIVVGTSGESGENGALWDVWIERSSDGGYTWERLDHIKKTENAMIQPSLFVDNSGGLRMVLRTKLHVMGMVRGDSTGRHWGPAYLTDVTMPNAGIDVVKLRDSRVLLVYNNSKRFGTTGRSRLDLAISSDDGNTWVPSLQLEAAPEGGKYEYSYPAVIQGQDGSIHLTYTWGRHNIKYVRLDPSEL